MIELDIDPETKKAVAVCLSVLLVLSSPVGMVLADDINPDPDITADDFEDGNANGWNPGPDSDMRETSFYGNWSLNADVGNVNGGTWNYTDAGALPSTINYNITGTFKSSPRSTSTHYADMYLGSDLYVRITTGSSTSSCPSEDWRFDFQDASQGSSQTVAVDDCNWQQFKVMVTDTEAKIKFWDAGSPEPATWDATIATDNTTAAGYSGYFEFQSNDAGAPGELFLLDNATVSTSPTYSVSGTVFNDTNDNEINESGEDGLSGVTVEVIDSNGDVVNSGTTNSVGDYSIGNIPNGTYSVEFSGKAGHEDETYDVVNVDGSNVDNIDVGLAPTASVSGSVLDADTDANISGATITAYNSSDGVVNTTTSGADGAYSLGLPNGTYTLEANATGYENGTKTVSVTLGTDKTGVDFELEPQPEEELELDTKRFIEHGEAVPYTAEIVTYDGDGNKVDAINVTGDSANLTVTSNNTTALTVDDVGYQLVATSDDSVNVVVNVTAEFDNATYSNLSVSKDVTVASLEMSNLKIIPGVYRISAIFGTGGSGEDAQNQTDTLVLLIAILSGVVGARWTTVFGGISFMVLTILIGWFGGWVSLGLVFVTVFLGAFLGLNVAVNIDYEVRPG